MKKSTKIFLGIIFLLALILRFWKLDLYPDAIDEDEMAAGYYGYSLSHAGTDEYGHKFPIYFESVGDYKYGLLFYFETIPVKLFGLNPITTRSASAVAGSLTVVAIYFLAYELLKNEKYGLISSFVLAVNPIFIHFSRVAYSNVFGGLFAVLSTYFYLKWIKENKMKSAIISLIAFVFSIYSYQSYRIFLPLIFLILPFFYIWEAKKNKIKVMIFSAVILVALLISFIPAVSRARSQDLNSLINVPKLTEQINEDNLAGTSLLATRIVHNKPVEIFLGVAGRYFSYFDPKFLFVEGSGESQRHTIPGMGIFYLIEAPIFFLGLLFITKYLKGADRSVPLVLFFAAPVAASLVNDPSSTTRSIMIVYGYSLITALGVFTLLDLGGIIKKYILGLILLLYAVNFFYFYHEYTVQKVYHHPWYSDVGLKEMVVKVDSLETNYDRVVITGGHYMPFIFYNRIDPSDFIKNSTFNSSAQANGAKISTFGKLVFNMPDCPAAGKEKVLYVCFGYKVPEAARLVDVIRYKDGQPAITLVEFVGIRKSPEKLPERVEYSSDIDKRFPNGILPENYATYWPTP